ncbi:hypothetical protein PFLmoz3_05074 [Pseudomonas fluorescens]|uniref:Uncharacterized protein n=1 Tax=Pseudomonas fluorescens TaxID=294 RepID=A0A109LCI9_PSEFL|nr:hypothetical protein PFLmoz3_05074 [Pseudomonas fluorescens]
MLAKNLRAPLTFRTPALSLTIFASKRTPTGGAGQIKGKKKPTHKWIGLITTPKDYYLRLAFSSMRRARSLASSAVCCAF